MPTTSPAQERLMQAAAHTPGGYGGVSQAVGKEFTEGDSQPDTVAPIAPQAGPNGRAAGIIFRTVDGATLLLQRGGGGDFPHTWGFPGGHLEDGETPEEAARREALEETGFDYKGPLRQIRDDGQFVAFAADTVEQFPVTICDESQGFTWAPSGSLPDPLHPGVQDTLRIACADTELAVAELMRDGLLPSPQRYGNMHLWRMRITSTGFAYRSKAEEYVYRPPEQYLNPEFLARCNGLPVIWEHPPKNVLDSHEFASRIIGTVMLPFIGGEDVDCIARVYDDEANLAMMEGQLSTSPTVVFAQSSGNATVTLESGEPLLIEGKPFLLDHLAICEQGVWDKGGAPTGVELTNDEVNLMTTENEVTDKPKADSEGQGPQFEKLMTSLADSMEKLHARMDSYEKAKADAMPADPLPVAADKKADSEEEMKKTKEKADAEAAEKEKADAENEEKENAEKADAQAKADSVYAAFGQSAPRALRGESVLAYRRRLADKIKQHSPAWKGVDLKSIADSNVMGIAEAQIFADAMAASRMSADVPEGTLREIRKQDGYGRVMIEFQGQTGAWMNQFKAPVQRIAGFGKGDK